MRITPGNILLGGLPPATGITGMGGKELNRSGGPIPFPEAFNTLCRMFGMARIVVPRLLRSRENGWK